MPDRDEKNVLESRAEAVERAWTFLRDTAAERADMIAKMSEFEVKLNVLNEEFEVALKEHHDTFAAYLDEVYQDSDAEEPGGNSAIDIEEDLPIYGKECLTERERLLAEKHNMRRFWKLRMDRPASIPWHTPMSEEDFRNVYRGPKADEK